MPGVDDLPPRLVARDDDSCTVPRIPAQGVELSNSAYTGSIRNDGLGTDPARLQTGSIELIESGMPFGEAASMVVERDCDGLQRRLWGGVWAATPNFEIDPPGGGLTAAANIIDAGIGVAYRTEAVAITGFSGWARHSAPSFLLAEDGRPVRFFSPVPAPQDSEFEVGDGAYVDKPADAISLLLMSSALKAGYLHDDSPDDSTRFVLVFPTRAAYLDDLPGGEVLRHDRNSRAPFADANTTSPPYCVRVEWRTFDAAGSSRGPHRLPMCQQVNVTDLVLQDANLGEFATDSEVGHLAIGLLTRPRLLAFEKEEDGQRVPHVAFGLPAVALSLSEVRNLQAEPGVLASYAISHRIVRERQQTADF